MLLNGAPVGARVLITCHGQSCPFSLHSMAVKPHKQCGRRARNRRCHAVSSYDLAAPFRGRRLKNGTSVTVKIVRPGWIGKYYLFRVRASNAPLIRISCLAPGGTRPGVGCQ
ncbi:MAG: hypothetical protein JO120_06300 [Solirubrobacterales bacterium]|nr:hypothetical protein [Solirubrobacterales bacterium]